MEKCPRQAAGKYEAYLALSFALAAIRATAAQTELNSVCNSSFWSRPLFCALFLGLLFHGNKAKKGHRNQDFFFCCDSPAVFYRCGALSACHCPSIFLVIAR